MHMEGLTLLLVAGLEQRRVVLDYLWFDMAWVFIGEEVLLHSHRGSSSAPSLVHWLNLRVALFLHDWTVPEVWQILLIVEGHEVWDLILDLILELGLPPLLDQSHFLSPASLELGVRHYSKIVSTWSTEYWKEQHRICTDVHPIRHCPPPRRPPSKDMFSNRYLLWLNVWWRKWITQDSARPDHRHFLQVVWATGCPNRNFMVNGRNRMEGVGQLHPRRQNEFTWKWNDDIQIGRPMHGSEWEFERQMTRPQATLKKYICIEWIPKDQIRQWELSVIPPLCSRPDTAICRIWFKWGWTGKMECKFGQSEMHFRDHGWSGGNLEINWG